MNDETDKENGAGEDPADDWAAALEEQKTTEGEATAEAAGDDAGDAADDWGAALDEQKQSSDQKQADAQKTAMNAKPVSMGELKDEGGRSEVGVDSLSENSPKLEVILDIPVRLSMEVGNTEISIRNLLQLNQGSVIELDRLAGEPLDVLVNGTLIAHGEVVVVNEKFGIRLTDVISAQERIKRLK